MPQLAFDILARDRASKVFDQIGVKSKQTEKNMTGIGSAINSRVVPAVAGMVAGFGAFDKIVGAGFSRLATLEDARKRLDQMGVSTGNVNKLMDGLTATVTGTAFALDQGAATMADFVSAGVDLDDVNQRLEMTADTAAFAQVPLNEIGDIFVKIQSQGKLTAEELNMLQERGVPALLLLADAAGVSAEAMRDLISSGQITAEKFFQLWESGSKGFGENNIKIEGSAKSMGDTVRGALANAETSLARLGAEILDDFMPAIREFADGTKESVDVAIDALEGMDQLAESTGLRAFTDWLKDLNVTGPQAFDMLAESARQSNDAIESFFREVFNVENVSGLDLLAAGTEDAADKTRMFQSAAEGAKSSAEGMAEGMATGTEGADGLTTSLEYAEEIAKGARDAIDQLTSSLFASGEAALDLEGKQDRLAEAIVKAKETSKDDKATKLDQREALRGVAEASQSLIQTMVEQGASTDRVVGKTESARASFVKVARQMGLTKGQANALADEYGLIPNDVKTQVKLIGAQRAKDEAREVQSALQSIKNRIVTVTIREQVQRVYRPPGGGGYITEFHSGGVIGGGIPRAHNGLRLGPDERLVIGQTGERIMSRRQTRALDDLVATMGRTGSTATATTMGAASASTPTVIELRSSGSRLDNLLLEVLRSSIRVKGGDVQVVLGSR